jgi:hypothetical protein
MWTSHSVRQAGKLITHAKRDETERHASEPESSSSTIRKRATTHRSDNLDFQPTLRWTRFRVDLRKFQGNRMQTLSMSMKREANV